MGIVTTSSLGPFYKYSIYIPAGDTISLTIDHANRPRVSLNSVPQRPHIHASRGKPYYKYSILLQEGDILYVNPNNGSNPWAVAVRGPVMENDPILEIGTPSPADIGAAHSCPPFFFNSPFWYMEWYCHPLW